MVWRFAQSTITNSPRLKSTALSKFNIRCSVHLVLISKGFLQRLVLLLQPIFFFASQRNVHGNSISHSHICLPVFYLYSPCCVGQNTPKVCLGICTAQTKLQLTVISTCTLPWKTVKDCLYSSGIAHCSLMLRSKYKGSSTERPKYTFERTEKRNATSSLRTKINSSAFE